MIPLDDGYATPGRAIGRGGHLRNNRGQALVVPPGGGRHRIYRGGSDLDPFSEPYGGPSIYGDQGTHIHTLCDMADRGQPLDDETIAAGKALGIDADQQRRAHSTWLRFLADNGWTVAHIECIAVDDANMVATNIDRVMTCGTVVDIKTANDYVKRNYLLQLASNTLTVRYCPETGERTPFDPPLNQHTAYLAWYDLRGDNPHWRAIRVDLSEGHHLLKLYADLAADDTYKHSFAALTPSPLVVEQPAGDDATHGPAAWCQATTLGEFFATYDVPGVAGKLIAVDVDTVTAAIRAHRDGLPATIEGLQALVSEWEPDARAEFNQMLTDAGCPKGDPRRRDVTYMSRAIERYTFGDISEPPQPRPAISNQPELPELNTTPDEGDEADERAVDNVKDDYDALTSEQRSWLGALSVAARQAGVSFTMSVATGEPRTVRRLRCMTIAVRLAAHDFDDDALRAILRHVIGDIADMQAFAPGALLGSLSADEGARAVEIVGAVLDAQSPMRFTDDGRAWFDVAA